VAVDPDMVVVLEAVVAALDTGLSFPDLVHAAHAEADLALAPLKDDADLALATEEDDLALALKAITVLDLGVEHRKRADIGLVLDPLREILTRRGAKHPSSFTTHLQLI